MANGEGGIGADGREKEGRDELARAARIDRHRAAAKAVQVPFPREGGAKKTLNAPNLRDEELLQWVADFLSEMFDVDPVSVSGSTAVGDGAADGAAGNGDKRKKRVFSVSE